MIRPSIVDFVDTLSNPTGVFRTLGLSGDDGCDGGDGCQGAQGSEIRIERDIYGEPALTAGNSAAIFTYLDHTKSRRFLKCHIRPNPHLRIIYDYVSRARPPLLPSVRLLRDELWVHSSSGRSGWVDVVEGEWIEGETLSAVIARAARKGDTVHLEALAAAFDGLCRELLASEWAHGDLKPENVIVRTSSGAALPNNERSVSTARTLFDSRPAVWNAELNGSARRLPIPQLFLIDCDAMWIPELAGQKASELGTPAYRHPGRTAARFDKRVDDYPATLISVCLHALALRPDLYGRFNTPDTLLFSPAEIVGGKRDGTAHAEILDLFALRGRAREYRMAESLSLPHPEDVDAERFFKTPANPTATIEAPPHTKPATKNLTSFVERGKWGFADERGRTIVEPFWDEVLEFRENESETNGGIKTRARLGGHWHTIGVGP